MTTRVWLQSFSTHLGPPRAASIAYLHTLQQRCWVARGQKQNLRAELPPCLAFQGQADISSALHWPRELVM
jgi:hypothetical protein